MARRRRPPSLPSAAALGGVLLLGCGVLLAAAQSRGGADLYDYATSPVVQLTGANFDELVTNTNDTWMVEFYAPWCGHCKQLAPAWQKAADHLRDIVHFGGVNCDDQPDLARRFDVRGFPTIKTFKGADARSRRPLEYGGARSAKALVEHAKSSLPNVVTVVKRGGVANFLDDERHLPHVLLITDKSATPALYKSLSASFFARAAFGELRAADVGDDEIASLLADDSPAAAREALRGKKTPLFVRFAAGAGADGKGQLYLGDTDTRSLRSFLHDLVDHPQSQRAREKQAEEDLKTVFSQPRASTATVATAADAAQLAAHCVRRLDSATCVALFVDGADARRLEDARGCLEELAERYKYDNLAFVMVDASGGGADALLSALGAPTGRNVLSAAALRGRKNKVAVWTPPAGLESSSSKKAIDRAALAGFCDRVLGGDISYRKYAEPLPEWRSPSSDSAAAAAADGDEATRSDATKTSAHDEL